MIVSTIKFFLPHTCQFMETLLSTSLSSFTSTLPSRPLRSASRSLPDVPRPRDSKTKRYGQRAIMYIAPSLWNALPGGIRQSDSIQSFKTSLKTNFFNCSLKLVTWCFEPSHPQRITSGLKTNFSLSPRYSLNKL